MIGADRRLPIAFNVWIGLIALATIAVAAYFGAQARLLWLALPLAAFGGIILLRQPVWGLFALVLLALLGPIEVGTGTEVRLNAVTLLTPALLGIWFLRMLRDEGARWVPSSTNKPLLLFLLASMLSLAVGKAIWDPAVTYPGNFLLVQLAQWAIFAFSASAFWLMGNLVRDEDTLRRITYCFLVLGGGLATLMMLPGGIQLASRMATFAVMRAPFWLLLAALVGGQLLFNHTLSVGWRWFLLITLVAVLFYSFGLQRERLSNMAAVVTVAGVLIWLRWPRLGRVLVVLALIVAMAFFPVLYNFAGGDAKWEESGGSRLALISKVVELTLYNPITGLGPAAYRPYGKMESFFYQGAYYRAMWLSSHNNYVDLFSHAGLLGLGLFLWFAVEVMRLGWRLRSRFVKGFAAGYVHAMLAAWIGALVIMLLADWILPFVYNIGFPGFQASVLMWLFLGGLVALEHMAPRHHPAAATSPRPENTSRPIRRPRPGRPVVAVQPSTPDMQLSIIIVNWNTRQLLAQCLQSLYAASYRPQTQRTANNGTQPPLSMGPYTAEVLVVDNASADGSAQMVREQFPWVHLIENRENVGFACANNQAMRDARGRYILLLNSDTEICSMALETMVAFADTYPMVGAVGPRLLNTDSSLQPSCHPMLTPGREFWRLMFLESLWPRATYPMQRWHRTTPRRVEVIKGACLLLRREALDQVGMLDESYFMYTEEVDLCYRLDRAGWQCWWVPEAQVVHHGEASSRQAAQAMYVQLYRSKIQFYRKFGGADRASQFKALVRLAYWPRLIITTLASPFLPAMKNRARTYRRLLAELKDM